MTRTSLWLLLAALTACTGGDDDTGPVDTDPVDTGSGCETDADGDGYCAETDDCDDTRDFVNPGAPDIPYNGRDEDCDGEDLNDVDEDGFIGERAGGDDCNDANPDIYPGAPEVCYGDLDMDCDGYIPVDDCDQDGFGRAGDCNDEDPTINPDADEVWYDGVDQDCKFDSDFDKDDDKDEVPWDDSWPLDSWPDSIILWDKDDPNKFRFVPKDEAEAYWSGLDCNDEEPLIGGNLQERWDGVDRNCDGIIDQLHDRDAASTWLANAGVVDESLGNDITFLGDLDADGSTEIAAADVSAGEYSGRIYVIPSDAETGKAFEEALVEIDDDPDSATLLTGWSIDSAGDLDGDGLTDLVVGLPLYNEGAGGVLVYLGSRLAGGGELSQANARAVLTPGQFAGVEVANVGDLDGDGLAEVATSGGYWNGIGAGGDGTLTIGIYNGADMAAGGALGAGKAEALITGDDYGTAVAGGLDADGDGVPDVLYGIWGGTQDDATGGLSCASGSSTVYMASGTDVSGGVLAAVEDGAAVTGGACAGFTLGMLDDINGNGYAEIVVGDPGAEAVDTFENGGLISIVDGQDWADGAALADIAMATVQAESSSSWLRVEKRSGDHDGDGVEDLLVGAPGFLDTIHAKLELVPVSGVGSIYAFNGTDLAVGGAFTTADAQARFFHRTTGTAFGAAWVAADLDEDGLDDLAVGAPLQGKGGVFTYFSSLTEE